jgi:hypothetical protein
LIPAGKKIFSAGEKAETAVDKERGVEDAGRIQKINDWFIEIKIEEL